ncbi:hypothetical protein F-VV57_0358 [Faustovirus]|nr:hypothetical protein F-VV57_0358 [Faustovirus]QJX73626.1 hypothetical protein F-VV63_0360 [Faustovirus]
MSTIKLNQSNVESTRLIQSLAQTPETAHIVAIINYMERAYLPQDYCVKIIVAEIMKSLSLADMLKLKTRYSNWIKEHHITYAAVLSGRNDMLIYYDRYVEKQSLVAPSIKSGNCQMFTKVFNDTMAMFENMVVNGSVPKEKINIKKNVWSWIDATVSSGNYQALAVILPRVKSIIADATAARLTRFFRKTPADALKQVAKTLTDNGFDLNTVPRDYLQMACVHGFDDVIAQYADELIAVNPVFIGMSANIKLFEQYLSLHDTTIDAIIMPSGSVVHLSSNIINGALESPYQSKMFEFLKHVLGRFEIAPNDLSVILYGAISYPNMLAMVNLGIGLLVDSRCGDVDERFAYLVNNGVDLDVIIKIIDASNEIIIGDSFVRALLNRDKNMLKMALSYATICQNVSVEITSATALTILNQCAMVAPLIMTLIDINRLGVCDNLWDRRGTGGAYNSSDKCRFTALVNHSYEKYVINMLELWKKYNIVVDTEGFIWAALCCDFNYFSDNKNIIINCIHEFVEKNHAIVISAPKFDFVYQTRDYRYQSMLHNTNYSILAMVIKQSPFMTSNFALKLAIENSGAFKVVFDLFPEQQYHDMFVVGGCVLKTCAFNAIFNCLRAKNKLPNIDVIMRAITLFASHGRDDTIKLVVEWGRGRIKLAPHDIALLAVRDRSGSYQYLTNSLNDKNASALSIAYIIGAFRRKTETILKLSASGVKYQRLSVQNILAQKINEDEYFEPAIENKIRIYNNQITEIAQKTKLYDTLHSSVLTTMQYKPKQLKNV